MLLDWIAEHMQLCIYFFLAAVFFVLANRIGKHGNRASREVAARAPRCVARPLFILLITGVLIVTLVQGGAGAFVVLALAALVRERTGNIAQPLLTERPEDMTPEHWFWVGMVLVGMVCLAVASKGHKVIGGDFEE